MPLPFEELQGKGVFDFSSSSDSFPLNLHVQPEKWSAGKVNCYVGVEPTSVLDTCRSPSPPTSTSTLSSPLAGGGRIGGATGSTDTTLPAASLTSENQPSLEKYGLAMEDWESVLSDPPIQEPSILRMIMGEIEDPSPGLNKLLQNANGSQQSLEFTANFGALDQSFVFEPSGGSSGLVSIIDPSLQEPIGSDFYLHNQNLLSNDNARLGSFSSANLLGPAVFQYQQNLIESAVEKPQILNAHLFLSHNQAHFGQNPAMYFPPPAKRLNSGSVGPNFQLPKVSFGDQQPSQVQLFPHPLQQRPKMAALKPNMVDEDGSNQEGIMDQLFQAAELIEIGNPHLAQGILARLNHLLSPVGKPFQRAAFYFKEALLLLLNTTTLNSSTLPPSSLVFKIGAYKSFSEISPVLHFANFTSNQAILEALDGFDRIHLVDFDLGHGSQWASFMQELALKNGGPPFLKITAFAPVSMHNEFELSFTRENLKQFANELNISLEIEILSLQSLNSGSFPFPLHLVESFATAVNLPASPFSSYLFPLPLILRFIKHLSPKIIVSPNVGFNQADVSFSQQIINSHKYYSGLLESFDAVNINLDLQQKVERFLLQPVMEKIILGRRHLTERPLSWRSLFLSAGFSPWPFSNFTESQADCLIRRVAGRGFCVEKRQASIVLYWQQKELISASAWRC